jgi:regulatory subunit for Cdc7p protein kinase
VVTTRSLPTEVSSNGGSNNATSSSNIASHKGSQPRTINPSLLEKSSDLATSTQGSLRERFTFEVPNGRKLQQLDAQDIESRKQVTGSTDVLQKAKHMGMKIWQLEKFGRILQVMGQGHDGEIQSQHNHNTRSNALTKTGRQSDLSQLLRNEQLNGPADREVIFTSNDMVAFKGPYIYIRDMDEKTKPIMVREYPKVQSREQGAWPQFRSAPRGKCPFIEEVGHSRREPERAKIKEKAEADVQGNCEPAPGSPRERATNVNETIRMQPPPPINRKRPLGELDQGATVQKNLPQQLPVVLNRCSSLEITADDSTDAKVRPSCVRPGLFGGEPMASGMQASNITSAIQSQMISSTSAAPGAKGGTSREVHGLQRKVLERTVAPSINKTGSIDKISDLLATTRSLRGIPATRAAKLRAQENIVRGKLSNVKEKAMSLEQDEMEKENPLRQKIAILASREFERELKPGYCENCREKFEDFEEVGLTLYL